MAKDVHLVCDTYASPSIKDAERDRRGPEDMVYTITGTDQRRPKEWQKALRSSTFKTSVFKFLAMDWMKHTYADILTNHRVLLGVDDNCFSFTEDEGKVVRVCIESLASSHEEADTRMVYHLHHITQAQETGNITIRSNDTDVLIILLYYMSQPNVSAKVWLDAGLSSNNTRRTISINNSVKKLDPEVIHALPAIHASQDVIIPQHL